MALLKDTDIEGTLFVNNNTQSTSSNTGSIVTNGSLSVSGNAYSGNVINVGNGDLRFASKRSFFSPVGESAQVGHFPLGWNNYNTGTVLNPDEFFASGLNGIGRYNNDGGTGIQLFRETAGADVPNSSGVWLRIRVNTAGNIRPGLGGWFFANFASVNSLIITSFVARVPVGYTINWASNSIGTGGTSWWMTPNQGTGKWERYSYAVQAGRGGNSSTNFFFLTGTRTQFDWWLSSATAWRLDT